MRLQNETSLMPPLLPTICPQELTETKFIRSKYFSNRKYSIRVDLYEHDMAKANIRYKGAKYLKGSGYICFDQCEGGRILCQPISHHLLP